MTFHSNTQRCSVILYPHYIYLVHSIKVITYLFPGKYTCVVYMSMVGKEQMLTFTMYMYMYLNYNVNTYSKVTTKQHACMYMYIPRPGPVFLPAVLSLVERRTSKGNAIGQSISGSNTLTHNSTTPTSSDTLIKVRSSPTLATAGSEASKESTHHKSVCVYDVCVCVCVHVCMCACVCACVHACVHVCVCV